MVEDSQALVLARIGEVDRMDEEQILATLGGEIVADFVYSFTDGGGRKQEGLSWAGVRELAQLRGNIMLDEPVVTEHDDHWRVMVKATDLDRNLSVWGGTHQPKRIRMRNGSVMVDDYAFEKAISKGQRNAIKNLLPIAVVRATIAKFNELAAGYGQRQVSSSSRGQKSNEAANSATPKKSAKGTTEKSIESLMDTPIIEMSDKDTSRVFQSFWVKMKAERGEGEAQEDVTRACGGVNAIEWVGENKFTMRQLRDHCVAFWAEEQYAKDNPAGPDNPADEESGNAGEEQQTALVE